MTLVSRSSGVVLSLALAALMTMPACAAQPRRRAVTPPPPPGPTIAVSGTVADASNGVPVEDSVVTAGAQVTKTNTLGRFTLYLPTGTVATISIEHPAFSPATKTFTAQTTASNAFTLVEKASVTIKTKTNETHIVDIGTVQFAFAASLSGYERSNNANLCKEDGTEYAPDRSEFARIVGPAVPAAGTKCCQLSILSANVEMKSGAKMLVYFRDTCSGDEVYIVGREKSTGKYAYFNFVDVAEVDFP